MADQTLALLPRRTSGYCAPFKQPIAVTLSLRSDGPLFFGVGVVDEYRTAHRMLGIAADQLARIARNSLHHSAAPQQLKATGYETIDAWQLNVEAKENPFSSSSPR